jgi:hypothetical protein
MFQLEMKWTLLKISKLPPVAFQKTNLEGVREGRTRNIRSTTRRCFKVDHPWKDTTYCPDPPEKLPKRFGFVDQVLTEGRYANEGSVSSNVSTRILSFASPRVVCQVIYQCREYEKLVYKIQSARRTKSMSIYKFASFVTVT